MMSLVARVVAAEQRRGGIVPAAAAAAPIYVSRGVPFRRTAQ